MEPVCLRDTQTGEHLLPHIHKEKFMGDMQMKETVFNLECKVDVGFGPADIVKDLAPSQVLDLITGLDIEVGEWALTQLIARRFQKMLIDCPAEDLVKTDEELMESLDESDKEFISRHEAS